MAEPFLSEIRIMSFGFPPKGWAFCNGQLLPINQNQALFSLLGTTYGGDGRVNFALPNLQGRVPLHFGGAVTLGEQAGQTSHTLISNEMPDHTHAETATTLTATTNVPGNTVMLAQATAANLYSSAASNLQPMGSLAIDSRGGSQPHENRQPYLVLSFCIALQGIFPSQN
jgi:microcystin-dependent protein